MAQDGSTKRVSAYRYEIIKTIVLVVLGILATEVLYPKVYTLVAP